MLMFYLLLACSLAHLLASLFSSWNAPSLQDVKRETERRRRAAASHHPSSLSSVRDHDQETKEKEEGQKEEEAADQRERIAPQTPSSPCSSPSIKHHQRLGQLAFNPHDYTRIDRAAVIYR